MAKVTIIQHPVGQGGMLSGTLWHNDSSLRWIYDCGSNQTNPLRREISIVASDGNVDILFLSHLDSDHVSGIDLLLGQIDVVEVVLPYLGTNDFAFLISKDIDEGRLTGTFLDFAANPARWLTGRGVKVVTFIDGPDDDSPLGGEPRRSFDIPGGEDGPKAYKWSRTPTQSLQIAGATVQHMSSEAIIYAVSAYQQLDWALAPYAHRPSASLSKRFNAKLHTEFGARASAKKISDAARSAAGREKLRACYDSLWNDHNLVSMSLYAGPVSANPKTSYLYNLHKWIEHAEACGWLSTGDTNLKSKLRRQALLSHYARFLSNICTLIVPHHGSAHSFHAEMIVRMPNLSVGIAAHGKNGYGHPHKYVRDAFSIHQKSFWTVRENPLSKVIGETVL